MKDDVPMGVPRGWIIDKTIYKVMNNTDRTEGRGREYVMAVYDNQREAKHHAFGQYVMGSDCPIKEEHVNLVKIDDDTYYMLGAQVQTKYVDPRIARANALAKLTLEEREILGVK